MLEFAKRYSDDAIFLFVQLQFASAETCLRRKLSNSFCTNSLHTEFRAIFKRASELGKASIHFTQQFPNSQIPVLNSSKLLLKSYATKYVESQCSISSCHLSGSFPGRCSHLCRHREREFDQHQANHRWLWLVQCMAGLNQGCRDGRTVSGTNQILHKLSTLFKEGADFKFVKLTILQFRQRQFKANWVEHSPGAN